jgi:hypothetical protein
MCLREYQKVIINGRGFFLPVKIPSSLPSPVNPLPLSNPIEHKRKKGRLHLAKNALSFDSPKFTNFSLFIFFHLILLNFHKRINFYALSLFKF